MTPDQQGLLSVLRALLPPVHRGFANWLCTSDINDLWVAVKHDPTMVRAEEGTNQP